MRTMADSVNVRTTTYTSGVLARAVMEPGAQAWWLLERGIGARRRVTRSVLVRASSARRLQKSVKAADPRGKPRDYGEDPARVTTYARALGLSYTCNSRKTECESESLPGYTDRATEFEKAIGVSAAYAIYSGAAHAELYGVDAGLAGCRPTASARHAAGAAARPGGRVDLSDRRRVRDDSSIRGPIPTGLEGAQGAGR